jgi:SAM-dependent methyltransferase
MPELLLGSGSNHARKVGLKGAGDFDRDDLLTLDFNKDHEPDVVWDLNDIPLPFPEKYFDTVNAFDVLEHVGKQGDWRFFFDQWSDIWRILKPDGVFCGLSPHPKSDWVFADPGHTRVLSPEMLIYLHQPSYTQQVGKTAMTDYRFIYKADFEPVHIKVHEDGQFSWILRAVKPSRIEER